MLEVRAQSFQCLLEDGVARSSRKTESFKDVRVEGELSHEGTIPESGIELESEEDKKCGEREVRRSPEDRGLSRDHIAKLDK